VIKGREKEVVQILQANAAVAVGNLLLGKYDSWDQFRELMNTDFMSLPRRNLKAGTRDVRKNLSKEIKKFYEKNFSSYSDDKIYSLWFEIEKKKGLYLPLKDFESEYFQIKENLLKDIPPHSTVKISLWGLQYVNPEDLISKDIAQTLKLAISTNDELNKYEAFKHSTLKKEREELAEILREHGVACRSCFLACFYFIEAYLNGIAWEWVEKQPDLKNLSKRKQSMILDTNQVTLKDKITKYPEIITGKPLWRDNDPILDILLSDLKPFRDSLVHPSPFAVPEKFGGYDKLAKCYDLKLKETKQMVSITYSLVSKIHKHVKGAETPIPAWIHSLKNSLA
jgi:hypothetical protein